MISRRLDERYVEEGYGQMWRRMMRGRISATTRGALVGRRYVTLLIATYMREKSFFALSRSHLLIYLRLLLRVETYASLNVGSL
jgi:hypothetical protein